MARLSKPLPAASLNLKGLSTERKLLVVADLGMFKAYELAASPKGTPRLELLEEIILDKAHVHLGDQLSDLSGRRAAPARGSWGGPIADEHNLRLEIRRRLSKEIAAHVRRLAQSNGQYRIWLAAHKEINRLILDALPTATRQSIELNLPRDLVKAGKEAILASFAMVRASGAGAGFNEGRQRPWL